MGMTETPETPETPEAPVTLGSETGPTVLTFPEARAVFLVDMHGDAVVDPLLRVKDLWQGANIAIRNPWDEERFLPGVAHGEGENFVMEVGESFGKLIFHPEFGWHCVALVPRNPVMTGVAHELIAEAKEKSKSFTEKLVKRASKKPR